MKIIYICFFSVFSLFFNSSSSISCEVARNVDIFKSSMITTLRNSPESIMLNDAEKKSVLYNLVEENRECITFGTIEDNKQSINKWIVYSRSLYALYLLGDENAKDTLLEEFERRSRRLEIIDCYADGKPYALCLLGIWSQVASYDQEERKSLIEALEEGRGVYRDSELASFWRGYNFSFDKIK